MERSHADRVAAPRHTGRESAIVNGVTLRLGALLLRRAAVFLLLLLPRLSGAPHQAEESADAGGRSRRPRPRCQRWHRRFLPVPRRRRRRGTAHPEAAPARETVTSPPRD